MLQDRRRAGFASPVRVCHYPNFSCIATPQPSPYATVCRLDDASFFLIQTTAALSGWDRSPLLSLGAMFLIRNDHWLLFLVDCCLLIWRIQNLVLDYLKTTRVAWPAFFGLAMVNSGGSISRKGPSESQGFVKSLGHTAGRYLLGHTMAARFRLSPLATEGGDTIVLLEGNFTPFVLRAMGDEGFRLVGECYVHGVIKGELWDAASRKLEDFRIV